MMATPTFVSPTKFATPPVVHKFTWGTEGGSTLRGFDNAKR